MMDTEAITQIASIVESLSTLGMLGVAVYYLHAEKVFWRDRFLSRVERDEILENQ